MEKKIINPAKSLRRKFKNFLTKPVVSVVSGEANYSMVVFCHLRWGFVYQRPQHLITRMAENRKVLFVEEPIGFEKEEENGFELEKITPNLHILKPKVKDIEGIRNVLKPFLYNEQIEIGWFYSASFSPLIADFNFETVVYDCMDELSLFKGAPAQLITQEKFLLSEAHVVFTGGKSLYESKIKDHINVHCFPSSVDRKHFEKATRNGEIPEDIKNIKHPIIGYFGVIDERIDLELLRDTARLLPDMAFVMIGPLAKIGPEELPRETNIHYLGMKSYKELPNYLRAFDMAMMPFALNDATKYISPTKTLEYMAAGKPIISTAIKDVVRDYSHCISIIKTAEEFSKKAEEFWRFHQPDNSVVYNEILENTSWDATAEKMESKLKLKVV